MEPEHADDHGPEVTALIISEHGQLRVDMLALLHGLDPIDRRRRFQDLARNLLRHDTAEQEVIYPILARLEEGSELRSEALRQEQVIAADLTRLLRRLLWHPDGRKTRHRIEEFAGRLEQHHDFEEQSLLPVISVAEPKSTRQMMGTWTGYAESIAPTRPHPHGPQRLPGLMTFGLALSLMDRMRDRARRLISRRRERRR
ncbi:MAG TPA: hemerythrin domain-containing protein [Acidimicrobiales bacterium]